MIRALKIAIAGGVCGLAAGLLSLVVEFAVLAARAHAEAQDASGSLGAVSAYLYAPYVAFAGLIVGAVWQWKRSE
jgi:hypothetical protein